MFSSGLGQVITPDGEKMAALIPYSVKTHKQRVLRLYKQALRNLESWYYERPAFRYQAVLLRAKFEENRNIKDEALASKLLTDGEEELWRNAHYQPKLFPKTIGGNAYGRESHVPDWVLDFWHPLEKAQYPEYFKRREERKKEYIKLWDKHYGPPTSSSHH